MGKAGLLGGWFWEKRGVCVEIGCSLTLIALKAHSTRARKSMSPTRPEGLGVHAASNFTQFGGQPIKVLFADREANSLVGAHVVGNIGGCCFPR